MGFWLEKPPKSAKRIVKCPIRLLIAVLSIIDDGFDTVQAVTREYGKIWESDPDAETEDYLVRQ